MSSRVFKDGNLYGVILTQIEMDLIAALVGKHTAATDGEHLSKILGPHVEHPIRLEVSRICEDCLCVTQEDRHRTITQYEAELSELGETRVK
jgi:hypothetical protein